MKKILAFMLAFVMILSLASCSFSIEDILNFSDSEVEDPDSDHKDPPKQEKKYKYTDFTPAEKSLLTEYLGVIIPFAPNDYYFLEGYNTKLGYDEGFNYCTIGNSADEFDAYLALFADYTLDGKYTDTEGDTWYKYTKGNIVIDLSYYVYEGSKCIDLYAKVVGTDNKPNPPADDNAGTGGNNGGNTENNGGSNSGNTENNGGNNGGNTGENTGYLNTDFTASEKQILNTYIGLVIPYIANDDYGFVGIYEDDDFEDGIVFYTVGNTSSEYEQYKTTLTGAGFSFCETYVDEEYGDTWYKYTKGDAVVEIAYYIDGGESYIECWIYIDYYGDYDDDSTGSGGNAGSGGNTGSGGSTDSSDVEIYTNKDKGLPSAANGIYNVDFTTAGTVKDVTDQGYYLDGCPPIGSPAVLVVPIKFSDGKTVGATQIDNLELAFGESGNYAYSVYNYYKISSYNQLTIDVTVLDEWYVPKYNSSHYEDLTDDLGYAIGDQVLMDEILQYLESRMDLSAFDSDNNELIDAIVLINNLEVGEDDFHWAYRYWNTYGDDYGDYYFYDGVAANDYLWASYYFVHEKTVGDNYVYTDTSVINTYTFIHEFGHIIGIDDYYDTAYVGSPLGGYDVMDSMLGDHNAYTKFNLGWITSSRLVVTDSSVTLNLGAFSESGDTIIIANNWDPTLGAYQEYYVLVYYTNDGLNSGEYGYFDEEGIIVYHVNSSIYKEIYEGETYYDVYNTNTDVSDENGYGTVDNLIEYVTTASGEYVFTTGDTLPSVTDDNGDRLGYTFTVGAIGTDGVSVTVTKR